MDEEEPFLEYERWAEHIHREGYRNVSDSQDYGIAKKRRLDELAPAPTPDTPPLEFQEKSTFMHVFFLAGLVGVLFLWPYDGPTFVATEGALICAWIYMDYQKSAKLQAKNKPLVDYRRMMDRRDFQSSYSDRTVQHRLDSLWVERGAVPVPITGNVRTVPRPEPDQYFTASKAGPLVQKWMQHLGAIKPRLVNPGDGVTNVIGSDYLAMVDHGRTPVSADQIISVYRASMRSRPHKRPFYFSRSGFSKEAIEKSGSCGVALFLYIPEAGTIEARSANARYLLTYGMTAFMNASWSSINYFFKGLLDVPVPFTAASNLWDIVPDDVTNVADWLQLASGHEPEVISILGDLVFLNTPGFSALIKSRDEFYSYDYLSDAQAETYAVLVPTGNVYVAFAELFTDIHDEGDENAEESRWYSLDDYKIGAISLVYSKEFSGMNETGKAALMLASARNKAL